MDAKCNRLMQRESGKVLNAKKSLLLHLSWSHAGWGDKTLHSLLESCGRNSFFPAMHVSLKYYKRNTFRIFGVQACTKCIGCKIEALWTGVEQESFAVCICIWKYHPNPLHFSANLHFHKPKNGWQQNTNSLEVETSVKSIKECTSCTVSGIHFSKPRSSLEDEDEVFIKEQVVYQRCGN